MPPPRFATRRRPERETWGTLAGLIAAERLGRPLPPAMQFVCDVALEINPVTRGLAYDVVLLTVPRQTGKTTGVLFTVFVLRCTMWGIRQMCVYTAQDRNSARRKFNNDFCEILTSAPGLHEGADYEVRRSNGSEEIYWTKSRSRLWISATNPSSGHGDALDMPGLDEIFEHHDLDIDQGFNPPMVTRPDSQKWLLSTAGDRRSVYLKQKRAIGRRAALEDKGTGFAHFEWSAGDPGSFEDWPDEWVYDRAKWWFVMPALGHIQTEAKVASQLQELGPRQFRRAFGNIDDDGDTDGSPIGGEHWERQVDAESQIDGRLVFGVEVSPDRSSGSVSVAGERSVGGSHVEVLESRPGTTWIVAYLVERTERHSGEGVAIAPSSPAGSLIPTLEAKGVPVFKMGPQRHAQACGSFYDGIVPADGSDTVESGAAVWHLDQPELNEALANAEQQATGEGAWQWNRRGDSDITPLVSATLALGALLSLDPIEVDEGSIYDDLEGFGDW